MDVLVLVPAAIAPDLPAGLQRSAIPYAGAEDIRAALAATRGPAVVLTDGLSPASVDELAERIRQSGRKVIEVRSERWDGESASPLSAACRGVISGFGLAGVAAAVALLEREAAGA